MVFERSRALIDQAHSYCRDRVGRWRNRFLRPSPRSNHCLMARLLDGELVVPAADGRSDFEEVRRRNLIQRPRSIQEAAAKSPAVLIVFDLLEVGGNDLRALPLLDRRRALREHVQPGPRLQLIEHVETHGEALFHAIAAQDFEGVVAKRVDASYRAGRQPAWVKIKNRDYSRRAAVEWQSK